MVKKLYVGNLGFSVSDSDLQEMFSPYGNIQSAKVIMDRDTNKSKGFGFVEMASDDEAQTAITALDGKDHGGRTLKVNEAKSRNAAPSAAMTLVAAPMVVSEETATPVNSPW